MADERNPDELSEDEVGAAHGEPLPDREAMTVLRPPLPMEPIPPGFTIDPPPDDA
jgi:hypothetical protein